MIASLLVCVAVFTGYRVHIGVVLSNQNSLLFQNIEALTQGEGGNGSGCFQNSHSEMGILESGESYCLDELWCSSGGYVVYCTESMYYRVGSTVYINYSTTIYCN